MCIYSHWISSWCFCMFFVFRFALYDFMLYPCKINHEIIELVLFYLFYLYFYNYIITLFLFNVNKDILIITRGDNFESTHDTTWTRHGDNMTWVEFLLPVNLFIIWTVFGFRNNFTGWHVNLLILLD